MPIIDWSKSECHDGWLHNYQIAKEFSYGVLERCRLCGDEQLFRIVENRVDNLTYLQHHLRNALPPFHSLFKREYKKHGDKE